MPKVMTVVLNWNGLDDTLACLRSLAKIETATFIHQIIVVDNGSTDDSASVIMDKFPDVILIQNPINEGFTGGNNKGIQEALARQADYVFILNNDTMVEPAALRELMKVMNDPSVGIVSPKIHFVKENKKMIWYAGADIDWANIYGKHRGVDKVDSGQYDRISETGYCTGCAMLVRTEVFKKVGLFDERFFAYYEDADFSVRTSKAGYKLLYVPSAVIFHKNAAASGGTGSKLQDYFIPRNRLLFGFKHASLRTKLALLREASHFLFTERRTSIADFFLGRLGKGNFGG